MAPEKSTSTPSKPSITGEPTTKEALFFYHILAANTGKLEVDWSLIATQCGYNKGSTAMVRYRQILKRLSEYAASTGPATPRKVGSGTNLTPSKVTKSRAKGKGTGKKGKGKVEVEAKAEEYSEDEEMRVLEGMFGKKGEGEGDEEDGDEEGGDQEALYYGGEGEAETGAQEQD